MAKIYIYPKGVMGQVLGGMIEYVSNDEIVFIDDALAGCTLQDYKEQLLDERALVHLAWDKRSGLSNKTIGILKNKLESYGIPYHEDSVLYYASLVAQKIEHEIKDTHSAIIGIELGGLAEDKHIGFLDDCLLELANRRLKIIYFCGIYESYLRIQAKIKTLNLPAHAVCMPCFYLDLISCVDVMCKVSWTKKNDNVPTIIIGHGLADFSCFDAKPYLEVFDYLCIGLKDFMPKAAGGGQYLESGYLAFDKIAPLLCVSTQKDSVLFAPYDEKELRLLLPFMKILLSDYKVILRSRSFCEHSWNDMQKIFDDLLADTHFSVDSSWQMQTKNYLDCFCLVCSLSTMRYSFPILALSPSLVLSDKKDCMNKHLGEIMPCDIDVLTFKGRIDALYANQSLWREKNKPIQRKKCL